MRGVAVNNGAGIWLILQEEYLGGLGGDWYYIFIYTSPGVQLFIDGSRAQRLGHTRVLGPKWGKCEEDENGKM